MIIHKSERLIEENGIGHNVTTFAATFTAKANGVST